MQLRGGHGRRQHRDQDPVRGAHLHRCSGPDLRSHAKLADRRRPPVHARAHPRRNSMDGSLVSAVPRRTRTTDTQITFVQHLIRTPSLPTDLSALQSSNSSVAIATPASAYLHGGGQPDSGSDALSAPLPRPCSPPLTPSIARSAAELEIAMLTSTRGGVLHLDWLAFIGGAVLDDALNDVPDLPLALFYPFTPRCLPMAHTQHGDRWAWLPPPQRPLWCSLRVRQLAHRRAH